MGTRHLPELRNNFRAQELEGASFNFSPKAPTQPLRLCCFVSAHSRFSLAELDSRGGFGKSCRRRLLHQIIENGRRSERDSTDDNACDDEDAHQSLSSFKYPAHSNRQDSSGA
jgi:hypothetical protein